MKIIADNINIMHPKISRALTDMDKEPIKEVVRQCVRGGADAIDVNPGPIKKQKQKYMQVLLEAIQEVTDLPLWLDSNDPELIRMGLGLCRKKPVINGFSLAPSRLENIPPIALENDCSIVCFLLKSDGHVPGNLSERLEIFQEIYERSLQMGLNPEQLIIDPVSVPLMWEDGSYQAQVVLDTVANLPNLVGHPVNTVLGLSNFTTSSPSAKARAILEPSYLSMLYQAGLNRVMLNINRREAVATAKFCNTLQIGGIFSWAELDKWIQPID